MTRRRAVDNPEPAGSDLSTSAADARPSDERYLAGQLKLHEAMMHYMVAGEPVPPRLWGSFAAILAMYWAGRIGDAEVLDALGVSMDKKHRRRNWEQVRRELVRGAVAQASAQGYLRRDPSAHEDTAFHKAADELQMSVATLYDIYRAKR